MEFSSSFLISMDLFSEKGSNTACFGEQDRQRSKERLILCQKLEAHTSVILV